MTDLEVFTFPCKICNKRIEYNCPADIFWDSDGYTNWRVVNPKMKQFYKAKARMIHNATHKGELDIFV